MARKIIKAADNGTTVSIGDSGGGTVTTKVITFTPASLVGGSFQLVGRQAPDLPWTPMPYRRRALAGAASDETVVSAAITGAAIISADASGVELGLASTITSGTMQVDYSDLGG